jgi:hypothetical protein
MESQIGSITKEKGVYSIYNTKTKKHYIGIATGRFGIHGRIVEHIQKLYKGIDVPKLQDAWNTDQENWIVCILELTSDSSKEAYYIQKYNSVENGYNVLIGRHHTEYSLNKMRGRTFTEKHIKNLSVSHIGNTPTNLEELHSGKYHTSEINSKRSEKLKQTLAYQREHKIGRYAEK